jgi:hypothetical protein
MGGSPERAGGDDGGAPTGQAGDAMDAGGSPALPPGASPAGGWPGAAPASTCPPLVARASNDHDHNARTPPASV